MKEQNIDTLRTALRAVRPSRDADRQFYRIVLNWVLGLTDADEGGVLTVSKDSKSMRIEEWHGEGVGLKSRILPITDPPNSICARAVLSGDLQIVPNVCHDPQYLPVSESSIRSSLVVPIVLDGAAVGAINLGLSAGIRKKWHSTRLSWSSEKRHIRCW